MRSKYEKDDPTWGRGNTNRKKPKMCSRASLKHLRFLAAQKRAADIKRGRTVCCTRTVELPSTLNVGDESSKLLFMLALDLVPKPLSKCANKMQLPVVVLDRLHPDREAEAHLKTTERIFQLFQRRKVESIQRRVYREPDLPSPEMIDLVSDDDSVCIDDRSDESDIEPVLVEENYCSSVSSHRIQRTGLSSSRSHSSNRYPPPQSAPYKIISCSKSRQPVFKPIVNNQDSGIFRNWKPESMSKLMNRSPPNEVLTSFSSGAQSKLMTSIKAMPSNPVFLVNGIPAVPFAVNRHKNQIQPTSVRKGKSTTAISASAIADSETVITID